MSTWTGGNHGKPDAYSDTVCCAPLCTTRLPYRYLDYGLHLCQEHAIQTWAIIQEQLDVGTVTDEPTTTRAPYEGWVYYIRTGGRIKIGHSVNLDRRLAQYPPDVELLYAQHGSKKLERTEHHRFRPHLTDGREWFKDTPEVTEPILAMAEADLGWRQDHEDIDWRRRPAPEYTARHTRRDAKTA